MLLNEFFGKSKNIDKEMRNERDNQDISNDLFWFIIDHDRLHKDFFHPIAKKIHHDHKNKSLDKENMVKEFEPMVKKGCQEFYEKNKMPGRFQDHFKKEFMKEMCERLYDHYKDDVTSGKHYKIGT
jgi:hypothetical protein